MTEYRKKREQDYLSAIIDLKRILDHKPTYNGVQFSRHYGVPRQLMKTLEINGIIKREGKTRNAVREWVGINPNIHMVRKCIDEMEKYNRRRKTPKPKMESAAKVVRRKKSSDRPKSYDCKVLWGLIKLKVNVNY